jgi:hypothetical protein
MELSTGIPLPAYANNGPSQSVLQHSTFGRADTTGMNPVARWFEALHLDTSRRPG